MPMVGADVAALRRLARSLRRAERDLEASGRRLAALVDRLPWSGPDHDEFVERWHRRHGPGVASVADELASAAARVAEHADRQDWASRSSGVARP